MTGIRGPLTTGLKGIAHILRDERLEVPAFQRNYAWTEHQVDEYWLDLKTARASNVPWYFLGTVVLGQSVNATRSVIDGQQRLATTTMLLAAARDILAEQGEVARAQTLQSMYLAAPTLYGDSVIPRLQMNSADKPYFDRIVLGIKHDENTIRIDERPAISNAFARLTLRLRDEVLGVGPKWSERLLSWIEFLEKSAQVISVDVEDNSDAFLIFETLNDRGMELSVADLIKNYLLGLSRERLEEAQNLWMGANATIEETADSQEVTTYIRQWWNSRYGSTRERDLYRSLRDSVRSQSQAIDTLHQLALSAPHYAALLDPDHDAWSSFTPRSADAAAILLELGLEQSRPLAIAAMSRLSPTELEVLLESMVSWSARGIIVGGLGGGSAERLYAEAAVRVSNNRSISVSEVFEDVQPLIPDNKEFESAFSNKRIFRSSYLRFILRSLSEGMSVRSKNAGGLVPVGLLSRSLENSGNEEVEEAIRQFGGRIGNFALLTPEEKRAIPSNLDDRKDYFEKYDRMPPAIASAWAGPAIEAIEIRQFEMAKRAVHVWPTFNTRSKDLQHGH